MSEYNLQHENPIFAHEIEKDFNSLMSSKNIMITKNPIRNSSS